MRIIDSLEKYGQATKPVALTIGNFDGVHRGHQAVLSHVHEKAKKMGGESVVISFVNHPSEVIHPENPVSLLCTPLHKAQLLENLNVDTLVFLTFTKEFSQLEARTFFTKLMETLPISNLVLGYDAKIGVSRKGDSHTIVDLSVSMGFQAEYIDRQTLGNMAISSSQIRNFVREGDLTTVNKLLARRYSIYAPVISGNHCRDKMGFPTANIDVTGLCLPPNGVYAVLLKFQDKLYAGVANLGFAPILRSHSHPLLEVYLVEPLDNLYGQQVEVFLLEYIRPERKFMGVEKQQIQIARDIEKVNLSLRERGGAL